MDPITHHMTEAYAALHRTNQEMALLWLHDVVFSWRWWIGVVLSIAPWLVWSRVRPKPSTGRLLYVMSFVVLVSSWLDFLGSNLLGLWRYYYEVLPVIPAFIPWDFTLIPVSVGLFLQFKPDFSPVLKAILFGVFFAYVGEPVFQALRMYHADEWRHIYSFAIMTVLYLFAHRLSRVRTFNEL